MKETLCNIYRFIFPDLCICDTPSRSVRSLRCLYCQLYHQHHQRPSPSSPNLYQIRPIHNNRHQHKVSDRANFPRGKKKDTSCYFEMVVLFLFARTIKPFESLSMIPVLWHFLNIIPIIYFFRKQDCPLMMRTINSDWDSCVWEFLWLFAWSINCRGAWTQNTRVQGQLYNKSGN